MKDQREWTIRGNEWNGMAIANIDGPVPAIGEVVTLINKNEYDALREKLAVAEKALDQFRCKKCGSYENVHCWSIKVNK